MMARRFCLALALVLSAASGTAAMAQLVEDDEQAAAPAAPPPIGSPAPPKNAPLSAGVELLVSGARPNNPGPLPVIGLRRQADSVVISFRILSDSREASTRTREIQAVMLAAIERGAGAGIELVTGGFELSPVTKANYQQLPLSYGDRADTSQAVITAKARLAGSSFEAVVNRLDAFIKAVPRTGRTYVDRVGVPGLTIVNPYQYRDQIVRMIADSARRDAAMFGPEYGVQVRNLDQHLNWAPVGSSEVFLFVPYSIIILPR